MRLKLLCVLLCCAYTAFCPAQSSCLVHPKNDQFLDTDSVQLIWNPSIADYYHIQLAQDSSFSTLLQNQIQDSLALMVSLPSLGNYYWRLRTILGSDTSNWCDTYRFRYFLPREVNDLLFWISADALNQADSTPVQLAPDLSGNGFDAFQNAPSNQPLFVHGAHKPYFHFDVGSPTNYFNTNITTAELPNDSAMSFFSVNQIFSQGGGYGALYYHGNAASFAPLYTARTFGVFDSDFRFINYDGAVFVYDFQLSSQGFDLYSLVDKISAGVSAYRNSILVGQASSGISPVSSFSTLKIGGNQDGGERYKGNIHEVLVYARDLDSLEHQMVEHYLRDKYAPPPNLGRDIVQPYGFCDTSITLDAGEGYVAYLWNNGATTQQITVQSLGYYSVTVTDIFEFQQSDHVSIITGTPIEKLENNKLCLYDSLKWESGLDQSFQFQWSNGDSLDFLSIKNTGSYYLLATDSNGCQLSSDTVEISVDSFAVQISLGPDTSLCASQQIALSIGDSLVTQYLWSDGTNMQTLTVDSTGDYSLIAMNSNSCKAYDTIFANVVGDAFVVDFLLNDVCLGDTVQMLDISSLNPPNFVTNWQWTFGDGDSSSLQNPSHFYSFVDTYSVQLFVETDIGCQGVVNKLVEVNPNPLVDFFWEIGCAQSETAFESVLSIGAGDSISNILWDMGNGDSAVDSNLSYSYASVGLYNVGIEVVSNEGCSAEIEKVVEIFPAFVVDFGVQKNCLGDTTLFFDQSNSLSAVEWQWDFGDGSIPGFKQHEAYVYQSTGVYNVILSAENAIGCKDSLMKQIIVNFPPEADFAIFEICQGEEVELQNNSFTGGDSIITYSWMVNEGNFSEESPKVIFNDTGTISIELEIITDNLCSDRIIKEVGVVALPNAAFSDLGFNPNTINGLEFVNLSTQADSFNWLLNDWVISNQFETNIELSQFGDYEVQLIAHNRLGCTDTALETYHLDSTYLSISLVDIRFVVIEQNNHRLLKTYLTLSNTGTASIQNFSIWNQYGNENPEIENWEMELLAGRTQEVEMRSTKIIDYSKELLYKCVEIRLDGEGEDLLTDNQACKTVDGLLKISNPYPNPATEQLFIDVFAGTDAEIQIKLYHSSGKLAYENLLQVQAGRNTISIQSISWEAGLYFLEIEEERFEVVIE